jgi:hypothetical protein
LAGAGLTVASLALPIGLYFLADGKREAANDLGPGHTGYDDARSTYDRWRTIYTVSWALPATLALVTTGAWLLGGSSSKGGDTRHSAHAARIAPTLGGLVVSGSF